MKNYTPSQLQQTGEIKVQVGSANCFGSDGNNVWEETFRSNFKVFSQLKKAMLGEDDPDVDNESNHFSLFIKDYEFLQWAKDRPEDHYVHHFNEDDGDFEHSVHVVFTPDADNVQFTSAKKVLVEIYNGTLDFFEEVTLGESNHSVWEERAEALLQQQVEVEEPAPPQNTGRMSITIVGVKEKNPCVDVFRTTKEVFEQMREAAIKNHKYWSNFPDRFEYIEFDDEDKRTAFVRVDFQLDSEFMEKPVQSGKDIVTRIKSHMDSFFDEQVTKLRLK